MGTILRKYGAAATIDGVCLYTANSNDLKANPTLASGDVQISKDGGAFANITTLPAATPASGVAVRVSLSATEMQAARIVVKFVDQTATKEWDDLSLVIETFGNASAQYIADFSALATAAGAVTVGTNNDKTGYTLAGTPAVNVAQWGGTNIATPDTAGHPKVTVKDGTGAGEIALTNGAIDQVLQTIEAGNVLTLETLADGILTPSKFADGAITAAKIATGAIDADALASDAVVEIANGLLDLTDGIETGETLRQFLRIIRAVLAGVSDATDPDAGTVVFKRKDGTTALTVIYNAQGDRTNVTIGSV